MKKARNPTRHKLSVLAQLCKFIPSHLVPKLARQYGIDKQTRSFSPWSHVVAMLCGQLSHAIGLNDVCDALRHHAGLLAAIRGATPPSRNGLSHANKMRDAKMAEQLFWETLKHLKTICPSFGKKCGYKGVPHRFRKAIHVADATTIELVANCIDWAQHRRRKAAAKCHMRLNLHSFLPSFAIVDTAKHHDNKRARELCAGIRSGEIVIFDKAYVDYDHLNDLDERGIFWVTRAKDNMAFRCVKKLIKNPKGKILRDDLLTLSNVGSRRSYPKRLRQIKALVEVDGRETEMTFITNNLQWAASSVCDLYKSRWAIEVFFKQIKQTLQLRDFVGHNANAVRWQIWTALLLYVLLRFQAHVSKWNHSFTRLFTMVRAVIWDRYDLFNLLQFYGTARAPFRLRAPPQQPYLPGFS